MAQKADILNELSEISQAVAAIEKAGCYQVPQGYFEHLPAVILQLINEEAEVTSVVLTTKANPYVAPQGYFDILSASILQKVKQGEAIVDLGSKENIYEVPQGYFEHLSSAIMERVKDGAESGSFILSKNNIYQVPETYFEGLADTILNRIKAGSAVSAKEELSILSPVLSGLEKKMPFAAPSGYFNELSENVVAGAQAIEFVNGTLENLSPMMGSLKHKNVYEIPAGYFANLPGRVLLAVKAEHAGGKVISMNAGSKWFRYAAAAAVIGIVAIAGWLFLQPSASGTDTVTKADKELQETLKKFENETEIVNYVENTAAVAELNNTNTVEIKAEDMKDMLADVSDEELQQYLEQQTGNKEVLTN